MMGGSYEGERELRLVLVGKTGVGKSASGNTILAEKKFDSQACSTSEQKCCRTATVSRNGKNIVVIDTPAIFDTELTHEQVTKEIGPCVTDISSPGAHALLLVVKIGRYTEEDKKTVERIHDTFGDHALKYMMVLFTRKDDLEDASIKDYINESGSTDLKELIRKCGHRYYAFNNRASSEERDKQVSELLTMIDTMVKNNRGSRYTNEMYHQAEKTHLQKIEEQRLRKRHPREVEIETMKQKCKETESLLKIIQANDQINNEDNLDQQNKPPCKSQNNSKRDWQTARRTGESKGPPFIETTVKSKSRESASLRKLPIDLESGAVDEEGAGRVSNFCQCFSLDWFRCMRRQERTQ